ncbi:Uncharacterised protein [Mycolicibacterium flavescens]|uniref:hypothetical protein n=1 Tax=Mycobacterium neumannii TaxID=2048551 RepID=UPI000F6F3453|nr:hypothetical protein [Mycobacterium neumannii]VEG45361.1 Uncharacterised protein [Mycolicibacterium flavescens]
MVRPEDVVHILEVSGRPLTVSEIAAQTGGDNRDIDAILWQAPDRFVWQPGHKWTVANPKSRLEHGDVDNVPDARSNLLSSNSPRELRALTLSSGLTISVTRRPLDSDAFFTVRSAGNTITLALNSMHEIFTSLPLPFANDASEAGYKELCEVLLSAWALYEDSLPGGSTKRATEDMRLLWGRRAIEMLRERDDE